MQTRWKYLITGFTMVVLCISVCTTTTNATVDWSDDFNDGNYDGWTVCNPEWGNPPSNWSAVYCYLQIEQDAWGTISHPSTIAYGTWSFDFKANLTSVTWERGVSIALLSNDINNATEVPTEDDWSCYGFKALGLYQGDEFSLSLIRWHNGLRQIIDASDTHLSSVDWHHIDVSRTSDGLFHVYHNGSLFMQGIDTELTTSELFVVSLSDWILIDNIVIEAEIPPPAPSPPVELIAIGGGVAAAIIVLVIVFLRRR